MTELAPLPLEALTRRLVREVDEHDAVYDLPLSKCFLGSPTHDLSVRFHGRRAATPLGPAAGPHSQMAQNIVLAWAGGSRIIELKTVQVNDELVIGRPCIDIRTVGYNIEWSQELRLEQSADEYVKGAMLIAMLAAKLGSRLAPGFDDTIYDMSVGYDLAGIRTAGVRRFIETMMDARDRVDHLRVGLPREHGELRDLDFPTRLSETLTLSTFHGCPPDEVERILEFLMREYGLNVVVKLNPMLLGPEVVDHLLHDVMGYRGIRVPASAFERDMRWDQACEIVERLNTLAATLGVGFGIKLTNTLIVEHDGDFLPASETEKYLSGPPLHVLAMTLVARFRERFGAELPISFSAGIDRRNFPDAARLGLVPITVCTDLLKAGGYARQHTYLRTLVRRLDDDGVSSLDEWIAGADTREAAILRHTGQYVAGLTADPAYALERNRKPPVKIGSTLELFDCITCDKCIPVCPNDANFTLPIEPARIPVVVCRAGAAGGWIVEERGELDLAMKHQIASYADFCNDCGNCDVFCPEDGGPYVIKPRFFGSVETFERDAGGNGFLVSRDGDAVRVRGRFGERDLTLTVRDAAAEYAGAGFAVTFALDEPAETLGGRADPGVEVDLTYAFIMDLVRRAVLDEARVNYVNSAL